MARAEIRIHARDGEVDIDVDLTDDSRPAESLLSLAMETVDWAFVKIKNEQSTSI